MDEFFKNAANLGLSYLDKKYVSDTTEDDKQQQKYEQLQQKVLQTQTAQDQNTKMIIYVVGAAAFIGVVFMVVKGRK